MTPPLRAVGAWLAAVAVASAMVAIPSSPAAAQNDAPVETEIEFRSGERRVGATVIAPAGAQDLPGLVLVAGAGPGPDRDRYRAHAEAFAANGIAVLLYDKRGADDGYSQTSASIEDLADDAAAAVGALRGRPEADPGLVGLHGHSEGAWVVIEAAARSTGPDFVITSGGSALTPEATQTWMNRTQLHAVGVEDRLLDPLGERLISALVADDLFRLAGYDPLPALAAIDRPFLGVFAEHDLTTPPGQSLTMFDEVLRDSGNPHYSLRLVPGVDHEMVPREGGGGTADPTAIDRSPGGYVDTVADWIHGLAAGGVGTEVDAVPEQGLDAGAVPAPPWFATATALFVALGAFALLFGAYPTAALVRRLRGRRPLAATWASRTVAAIGAVLPLLVFAYAAWTLMSGGTTPLGPVVAGRPLPWLVFQCAGAALVVAAVVLAVQWWRRRDRLERASRMRFGALIIGTALLVPWGAYWGLLA